MKKTLLYILLLLIMLLINSTAGASVVGSWQGELKISENMVLPLVFHIKKTDKKITATMDSPAQGAKGIPVSEIEIKANQLTIKIASIGFSYSGELQTSGEITGTFKQAGMSLPLTLSPLLVEQAQVKRPQTPKAPFNYNIEEVTFENKSAAITLAGTLTLPKGKTKSPVVVLVSGSGPQDRDETLFEHKPFWVIAHHLTNNGIAVLRFDDRGTHQSNGDFASATSADFATDVEAAMTYLAGRDDIDGDKIGIIGHSEGGMIAPMVAAKNAKTAFIIMLAGLGIDGSSLLLEQSYVIQQIMGVDEEKLKQERTLEAQLFADIVAGADKASVESFLVDKLAEKPEIAAQKAKQLTSPWMKFFLGYHPAQYLSKVTSPVLAINGDKDVQVLAQSNLNGIKTILDKAGHKDVTIKSLPGLNHLFQQAESGMPDEYGQIEQTMAPQVLTLITQWIKEKV